MSGIKNKEIDLALIKRIQNDNDQSAYASLMAKYEKAVYFTVLKMVNNKSDAEDITMQTFTKAFKNLSQYNSDFAFSTWVFRIASNTAIDHIRKKRLETTSLDKNLFNNNESSVSIGSNIVDESANPEKDLVMEQRSDIMKEVIDTMDEKYKVLIQLYFFEELKYDEIAVKLEIPLGTVKVRLKRAKEFLAKLLDGHQDKY